MKKTFPTLAVCGVYTGRVLSERGFGEVHGVMDHFYPGIMTIGCAAMGDHASAEVLRQHPELKKLGPCDGNNWRTWAARAEKELGATLDLEGPHNVSESAINDAFKSVGKGF